MVNPSRSTHTFPKPTHHSRFDIPTIRQPLQPRELKLQALKRIHCHPTLEAVRAGTGDVRIQVKLVMKDPRDPRALIKRELMFRRQLTPGGPKAATTYRRDPQNVLERTFGKGQNHSQLLREVEGTVRIKKALKRALTRATSTDS